MSLNPLTPDLAEALVSRLPPETRRDVTESYLTEPRGIWTGQAGIVLAPADTGEAARIVRFAADHRIAVLPWGGGTGLVGGQVMGEGEGAILLSTERMTRIRGIWPEENVLVAEAGAILADVQAAAEEVGRLFPLSLASQGSARIGGLLSTNAGGVNVVRYGNARDLTLGIEAVLPDGSILNGLRRLRKDNTGYDLRHLLIGAEGTLGLITAAALRLVPRPSVTGVALMVVPDPQAALNLLHIAQRCDGVSAFELISGQGLAFLDETNQGLRQPFDPLPDWCVLIELGLTEGRDADACLEGIFADGLERGLVGDGVIAQSNRQRDEFWDLRERLPEANRQVGAILSNDISLPLSEIPDFVAKTDAEITAMGGLRINTFGHLGDGNLHYNIFPPKGKRRSDYSDRIDDLTLLINEAVMRRGGSFSAEHGVGRMKVATLERYGDPAKLAAMRAIKDALDPCGIMNPGAVLRQDRSR